MVNRPLHHLEKTYNPGLKHLKHALAQIIAAISMCTLNACLWTMEHNFSTSIDNYMKLFVISALAIIHLRYT